MEALRVGHRIGSDLDLDALVAVADVAARALGHRVGRVADHRAVERDGLAVAAAERLAERDARQPRCEVAGSHVERRLRGRLAQHGRVEAAQERTRRSRIGADDEREQLGDARAHAGRERGRVERSERGGLAVPRGAVLALERHDRRVEAVGDAARARVAAVAEGLPLAVRAGLGDLHQPTVPVSRRASLAGTRSRASTSSTVSRRLITSAADPDTRTVAGRGSPLKLAAEASW